LIDIVFAHEFGHSSWLTVLFHQVGKPVEGRHRSRIRRDQDRQVCLATTCWKFDPVLV
jgi:hypothetical protein